MIWSCLKIGHPQINWSIYYIIVYHHMSLQNGRLNAPPVFGLARIDRHWVFEALAKFELISLGKDRGVWQIFCSQNLVMPWLQETAVLKPGSLAGAWERNCILRLLTNLGRSISPAKCVFIGYDTWQWDTMSMSKHKVYGIPQNGQFAVDSMWFNGKTNDKSNDIKCEYSIFGPSHILRSRHFLHVSSTHRSDDEKSDAQVQLEVARERSRSSTKKTKQVESFHGDM